MSATGVDESPLSIPSGFGAVVGVYAPNTPLLIAPEAFGPPFAAFASMAASAAVALRRLRLVERAVVDAFVVVTPHFVTPGRLLVQASDRPPCLHDFGGMPKAVEEALYEPPGSSDLARAIARTAAADGLPASTTTEWGLDHGAWATMMHLAPAANVPTVAVSVNDDPLRSFHALGRSIDRAARRSKRRVAVVGTGSIVHNFDLFAEPPGSPRWRAVARIEAEIVDRVEHLDLKAVVEFDPAKWTEIQPEGNAAPLLAVTGAMGDAYRSRLVYSAESEGVGGYSILEFVPRPAR